MAKPKKPTIDRDDDELDPDQPISLAEAKARARTYLEQWLCAQMQTPPSPNSTFQQASTVARVLEALG